jgi:hypothetical protein
LAVDLDEGARQLLCFPWRSGFAGEQPYGDVLDPHGLAGPQSKVADDAVALVEETQHGDPLGHRRNSGLLGSSPRNVDGDGLVFRGLVRAITPGCCQQQRNRESGGGTGHAYSGFHAS